MDSETSSPHEPLDDILWGDCTEELYLRRMLKERQRGGRDPNDVMDDETYVDSIMGQSTVAEILGTRTSPPPPPPGQNDDEEEEEYSHDYDIRPRRTSWTRFEPMARSVTTMDDGTTTVTSTTSASLEAREMEDYHRRPLAPTIDDDDVQSFYTQDDQPFDERYDAAAAVAARAGVAPRAAAAAPAPADTSLFPGGVVPKYVDSDDDDDEDESTSPYFVQEMGGGTTKRGKNPEEDQECEMYDEEALQAGQSQAGISTLTGDTLLRYGQMGSPFEYEHPKWWLDLEEKKRRKLQDIARTRETSHQNTKKQPDQVQLAITKTFSNSQEDTTPSSSSEKETSKYHACCSRFVRQVAGNDKMFRRFVALSIFAILLFAALAIYAIVESTQKDSNQTNGSASSSSSLTPPSTAPANQQPQENDNPTAPTSSPLLSSSTPLPTTAAAIISDPYGFMVKLIREIHPSSLQALLDQTSPQYQALEWLIDDLKDQPVLSNSQILQRWTLAIIYFGINGDHWAYNDGWLSSDDICEWFSTSTNPTICDDQGLLQRLELLNNNLLGDIPDEIQLLSESLLVLNLSQNRLEGAVPESLGELTNVSLVRLEANNLEGTIPSTLCDRQGEGLVTMFVDCSEVTCSCCERC